MHQKKRVLMIRQLKQIVNGRGFIRARIKKVGLRLGTGNTFQDKLQWLALKALRARSGEILKFRPMQPSLPGVTTKQTAILILAAVET
jgi:hypothetical protein